LKRKFVLFFAVIFVFLFVSSCGKDPVQADLLSYINDDLPKVFQLESDAVSKYASVTGTNYSNDGTLYDTMTQVVIPKYKDFLDNLVSISPKTKEVQEVHKMYVDAAKAQYEAFTQVVTALEKQDPNIITQANEKLSLGRDGIKKFQTALEELAAKHNVNINK
jgi:hypothetical protein